MDGITTAAIAYVAKDGIEKLLGPTFEYVGEGLKNTIEKFNVGAKENISKIFEKAINKKRDKLDEDGKVSPRIVKDIVLDGSFCDTNILQEYYSGVLASARTIDGDDADVFYLNIIKGLSSEQLKLHYVVYSKFLKVYKGEDVNLHADGNLQKFKVTFMLSDFIDIFGLNDNGLSLLTSQSIPALYNVGLLSNYSFDLSLDKDQFSFNVTMVGINLFLRALGFSDIYAPTCLIDSQIDNALDNIVNCNEL